MNWRDHIDSDPGIIGGKPKIKGTRIAVESIVKRVSDGWSVEQLIEAYPNITADQILACLAWNDERLSADEAFLRRRYLPLQTVYIETSVVSFLRENALASPESVERQTLTRTWWNRHRQRYLLVTSQYVLDEARMGSPDLARERVGHLSGIPLVRLGDQIDDLAARIIERAILPKDAIIDALHIASAAVSRVDFLLTWNCSHIANPMILPRVFRTLDDFGLPFPVICTPKDMLIEVNDDRTT